MGDTNSSTDEESLWYYEENNRQTGPVSLVELVRLVSDGKISCDTKVWKEGMPDWQPAMETELREWFPKDLPPPLSPLPLSAHPPQVHDAMRVQTLFMAFWISNAVFISLEIISFVLLIATGNDAFFGLVILVGLGGTIAVYVAYCMLLHALWSLIPASEASTTPGKAVGFLFIPFFNFYWNFIAFLGLARALNIEAKRNSVECREVNESLSLAYCILNCCTIVPILGMLVPLAQIPIWIISLGQMKNAGVALILKQRA